MPSIVDGDLDDLDDLMIFPLTDIDGDDNNNICQVDEDDDTDDRAYHKGKRDSEVIEPGFFENGYSRPHQQTRWTSARSIPMKINANHLQTDVASSSSPKLNWMHAMKKIKHLKDPWEKYRITEMPSEIATRHRYHALKKIWVVDKVEVKQEKEAFDHGAMRACYRVKKLSSFSRSHDWKHSQNYVAKRYIRDDTAREVYFEDVRLQMEAKLWGEEYNRHNPPKKVDVFQMCVLEFENREPGDQLYHLEHYIEGQYIKFNSNSGFVDENARFTPQAFSHFTFERSGHQLIVVDIQGVGNLWTDPQIHTAEGKDYGDGNLGIKGMALFFHSHTCNAICESLGLSKFDLAPSEEQNDEKFLRQKSCSTRIRGDEELCIPASPLERSNLRMFFERSRRLSTCSSSMMSETSELSEDDFQRSDDFGGDISPRFEDYFGSPMITSPLRHRQRFLSESEESSMSASRAEEEERLKFQLASSNAARPACVAHEINLRNLQNHRRLCDSVLGLIHHELAKYHEVGRFTEKDKQPDMSAAMFHEQFAADLGVKEAMVTLASIYFGLTHEVLVNVTLENTDANLKKGSEYMVMAANAGDRFAMLYLARAYETGVGLDGVKSYSRAVEWYSAAADTVQEDECGEFDAIMENPLYELKAKMAELYLQGGYDLERDPSYAGDLYTEAAEFATAAMKGRIANKYYALAEEAYVQMDG